MVPEGSPAKESIPLLTVPADWGNIEEIIYGAPRDVVCSDSWLSVVLVWLFFPVHFLIGFIASRCESLYAVLAWVTFRIALADWPCYLVPITWTHLAAQGLAWVKLKLSRLGLFIWEKDLWGGGPYFFHGEAIWIWRYEEVSEVLKHAQPRTYKTGASPTPDVYPTNALIFKSNDGPNSEWAALRRALHTVFLDNSGPELQERLRKLRSIIAADWPNPKLSDTDDWKFMGGLVGKSVFYLLTGVLLDKEDTETITQWYANAVYWLFPRLLYRMTLNFMIRIIQKTRLDTVKLIEKHQLHHLFVQMNELLPPEFRRTSIAQLCDEVTFIFGFAGVGGCSNAMGSVSAFLKCKLAGGAADGHIDFGDYSTPAAMAAAYRQNPDNFILETLRLDPPVTSATTAFDKDQTIHLAGQDVHIHKGFLKQYTLSISNRDPSVFEKPAVFDPTRANLRQAITFNGAFGTPHEEDVYPRICPGRNLAIAVLRAIFDHLFGLPAAE